MRYRCPIHTRIENVFTCVIQPIPYQCKFSTLDSICWAKLFPKGRHVRRLVAPQKRQPYQRGVRLVFQKSYAMESQGLCAPKKKERMEVITDELNRMTFSKTFDCLSTLTMMRSGAMPISLNGMSTCPFVHDEKRTIPELWSSHLSHHYLDTVKRIRYEMHPIAASEYK